MSFAEPSSVPDPDPGPFAGSRSGPPSGSPADPSAPPARPSLQDATRGRLLYDGDWNPEQWPRDVWQEDVRLMRAAGVNTVTVGVFSWATIEPRPGARHFGWLDRAMDLLAEYGFGAVLATPTASPPPWLGALHPETLPRAEDGTVVWYGSRNHFCASSPVYRARAAALTEDLATRYAHHPALIMWHINNEYGTTCWCDTTAAHFRRWLRTRYGTIGALNDAWGSAFWSQAYGSWDEILPPRRAQYLRNPAQGLDFRRFTSDALLECFTAERDIVARHSPRTPVTTNFMPLFTGQDGWAWADREDVVSVDVYADPKDPDAAAYGALVQDMTRSQAGGGPWMLMEQAAEAVSWRPVNRPKPPGLTRLWSLQAVARGADAVCFFQWRASRQGGEKFHSAMLGHSGPGSRVFQEVTGLGADLARIGPAVSGTRLTASAAILYDWHSWWAGQQDGRPSVRVDQAEVVGTWHRILWRAGITTDFARPAADLTPYPLVLVPQLYLLSDAALDGLVAYVGGGGTLVCGFFTGVADTDDRIRPGGMDARLREILGLEAVHEWWPLEEGQTVGVVSCLPGPGPGPGPGLGDFDGEVWSEHLVTAGAQVIAHYRDGDLDGLSAVTRHVYGDGRAWYLSTLPDPVALRSLLTRAADEAGVRPPLNQLPAGVEAVHRGDLLFLLNHGTGPVTVPLPGGRCEDLLTDHPFEGMITLGRFGVAVLRQTPG